MKGSKAGSIMTQLLGINDCVIVVLVAALGVRMLQRTSTNGKAFVRE